MDDRELSRLHSLQEIAQRYADENTALRAKLARVEALPAKWRQVGHTYEVESVSFDIAARELEAALKG